jgi:hypothetical protein
MAARNEGGQSLLILVLTITLPSRIIARLSGQLIVKSFPNGREWIGSSWSPNYKRRTTFRYDLISRTIATRQIRRTHERHAALAGYTWGSLRGRRRAAA